MKKDDRVYVVGVEKDNERHPVLTGIVLERTKDTIVIAVDLKTPNADIHEMETFGPLSAQS